MQSGLLPIPVREFDDRALQVLLDAPGNLKGLMCILRPDLVHQLDFSRMRLEAVRSVSDRLRKREGDMLFRIPYFEPKAGGTREVMVLLLIEPQSRPTRRMGFRLLRYMVGAWDKEEQEFEQRGVPEGQWRLSPIIPIVFYTGKRRWRLPVAVESMMEKLPALMGEFVPQFGVLLLDVKEPASGERFRGGHPFARVLDAIRQDDAPVAAFEAAVLDAVADLATMAPEDRVAFQKAILYLFLLVHHRRSPQEARPLIEKMAQRVSEYGEEDVTEMGKSYAQVLVEQGVERGREEGREEGLQLGMVRAKQDDLLRLMSVKFGGVPDVVAGRVRRLEDTEALDRLLERLLSAESLEAMGL